jgi:hypothetical protein
VSRRDRSASGSSSSRGARLDGRLDVSCPQCGTRYRVAEDLLEQKLECQECHRVFFPQTTVGKRIKPPSNTGTYVMFGIIAVLILASFVWLQKR